MDDKIKPISRVKKVSKVRKVKLRLYKRKTMKGLYFNEMLSRANDKKVQHETAIKEETHNGGENHLIDTLC
jgi:hypothetical protein